MPHPLKGQESLRRDPDRPGQVTDRTGGQRTTTLALMSQLAVHSMTSWRVGRVGLGIVLHPYRDGCECGPDSSLVLSADGA
jgi:hypothetical protein